ncbi:putative membrane protein [Pedobacter sp. UYP30]|uniref:TMEM175 family protein n=1 Tax=Pedobacter sp. UYP30 TaxID=1756400 RepID=UPI003391FEE9
MKKNRLEAFSDGVLAIIITIMILEIKVPSGADVTTLKPLIPKVLSYILSFIYVGIYWNNHHHLLYPVKEVNGKILWGNLHLLFWLSLIPVASGWMGERGFMFWPVVIYGAVLLFCAIAFAILLKLINASAEKNEIIEKVANNTTKEKASVILYALGMGLCFLSPYLGASMYAIVAMIWIIPDKRVERALDEQREIEEDEEYSDN